MACQKLIQTIICCKEKSVLVAVYAEWPRRRRLSTSKKGQNGHYHHHHYHHIHLGVSKNAGRGKGYNRKAELLDYARNLRASAQPAASTGSSSSVPPSVQIVAVERKPKRVKSPTCLGKWELLIPSFIKSMANLKTNKEKGKKKDKNSVSITSKMKFLVKSLQVQKKGSFLSKLFTKLRKHR
ncbi:hypothetical protein ACJIZ3_009709 [Penstemon smallii]|uniref:Uncharacterized protein n=1 Tax=Penstemon smallii TaxID=265156 RepID=A0ABD3TF25_9LAMI